MPVICRLPFGSTTGSGGGTNTNSSEVTIGVAQNTPPASETVELTPYPSGYDYVGRWKNQYTIFKQVTYETSGSNKTGTVKLYNWDNDNSTMTWLYDVAQMTVPSSSSPLYNVESYMCICGDKIACGVISYGVSDYVNIEKKMYLISEMNNTFSKSEITFPPGTDKRGCTNLVYFNDTIIAQMSGLYYGMMSGATEGLYKYNTSNNTWTCIRQASSFGGNMDYVLISLDNSKSFIGIFHKNTSTHSIFVMDSNFQITELSGYSSMAYGNLAYKTAASAWVVLDNDLTEAYTIPALPTSTNIAYENNVYLTYRLSTKEIYYLNTTDLIWVKNSDLPLTNGTLNDRFGYIEHVTTYPTLARYRLPEPDYDLYKYLKIAVRDGSVINIPTTYGVTVLERYYSTDNPQPFTVVTVGSNDVYTVTDDGYLFIKYPKSQDDLTICSV